MIIVLRRSTGNHFFLSETGFFFIKSSPWPSSYSSIQIAKVIEASGVKFTLHDLRRLFVTTAESLDLSSYVIKMLVNHALPKDDVTAGYVVPDPERLRKPAQKIEDRLLTMAGAGKKAKVVPLHHAG